MFIGTNVCQNSKPPFTVEFENVWYEFGVNDPVVDYTKKTDSGPVRLQNPGEEPSKEIWKGKKPGVKITSHDATVLLDECLADLKKRYPGTVEKPNDPILLALECVSNQVNLWTNNATRQANTPVEPITAEEALPKMEKTLRQAHPDWSAAKVTERAKLMLED